MNETRRGYIMIDMPTSCKSCPFSYMEECRDHNARWEQEACRITGKLTWDINRETGRAKGCPLKEWRGNDK